MTKIGILVGSLRKESFSKKIASNVAALFPEGYETEFIEIGNLPFYNQDDDNENNVLTEYTAFRNRIKEIDAVLFVTPEYNRSVPAVLSNALDIGSRPYGASVWNGNRQRLSANLLVIWVDLAQTTIYVKLLICLNMPVVQQPEAYIGNTAALLDENGKVKNEGTIQFLQSFVDTFVDLIKRYQA